MIARYTIFYTILCFDLVWKQSVIKKRNRVFSSNFWDVLFLPRCQTKATCDWIVIFSCNDGVLMGMDKNYWKIVGDYDHPQWVEYLEWQMHQRIQDQKVRCLASSPQRCSIKYFPCDHSSKVGVKQPSALWKLGDRLLLRIVRLHQVNVSTCFNIFQRSMDLLKLTMDVVQMTTLKSTRTQQGS